MAVNAADYGLTSATTPQGRTDAINAALATDEAVFIPKGRFDVSAGLGGGIVLRRGSRLTGESSHNTILNAVGGASLAQIKACVGGSVIRRDFNPLAANDYVSSAIVENLGIVLNHPALSVTTTDIQVGVDFRNMNRSVLRDCWVGNYDPDPAIDDKGIAAQYLVQGYPVVCGGVNGSHIAYAGTECNTIERNFLAGGYRVMSIDLAEINPSTISAAFGTRVLNNDIQIGHTLLIQGDVNGQGCEFRGNIVQACQKRAGDTSATFAIYLSGLRNKVDCTYLEAGTDCQFLYYSGAGASRNTVNLCGAVTAAGGGGQIFVTNPVGAYNRLEYFANTGAVGTWNSLGAYTVRYNA